MKKENERTLRGTLKNGITWLLLLLILSGGCTTPMVEPESHERVPSPTSALSMEHGTNDEPQNAFSEGMQLLFTEIRSAGNTAGAYAGCESADWFELYNAGDDVVDLGRLYLTNDPEKPDKHPLPQTTWASHAEVKRSASSA